MIDTFKAVVFALIAAVEVNLESRLAESEDVAEGLAELSLK